jgi:dUTP pyrophosphatase
MEEINDLLNQFPNDEAEIKRMLSDMGFDLDDLQREFDNYSPKKPLNYEVVSDNATEPKYAYESDSGFDLHSTIDVNIAPFDRKLVPTGLKFDIPDGFEIQVRPKSGLALKKGLTVLNTPGTIDSGYDGEIMVIMFNTTNESVTINIGDKIAQAVLCPVVNGRWVNLVRINKLDDKERGANGFGSTGF